MSQPAKRRRRWLQISLRTMLLLMAVVALWLGFVSDRARRQHRAVVRVRELGGIVTYRYEYTPDRVPPGPAWLRGLLGDDYFSSVRGVALGTRDLTDADLDSIRDLTQLRVLRMNNGALTDAGMERLQGLTHLTTLSLESTQVGDHGLAHLKGLVNLEDLLLVDTEITDEGLAHLAKMKKLNRLWLGKFDRIGVDARPFSEITDAGLVHLEGLTGLKRLILRNTKVTDAGKRRLREALPGLSIQEGSMSVPAKRGARWNAEEARWVPEE